MPSCPLLAGFNVLRRPFFCAEFAIGSFQKRIKFETDIAIVAIGLFIDRSEALLSIAYETIRQRPGNRLIVETFLNKR